MTRQQGRSSNQSLERQYRILLQARHQFDEQSDIDGIRRNLLEISRRLVAADAGTLGLVETRYIVFREYFCHDQFIDINYRLPASPALPGCIHDMMKPQTGDNDSVDPPVIAAIHQALGPSSRIRLPVIDQQDQCFMGCLELHRKAGPFHNQDLELLQELVAIAASAIRKIQANLEQQRMQEELLEARERYRKLVESTSDWIWEVDGNGTYTYASPRLETLLGYQPEEIIGRTPFDLMPPQEAQRVRQIFVNQIAANQLPIERLVNTNLHKEGHPVILETSGVPVYDDKGRFTGYRGIDRDISDRYLNDNSDLARMVLEHTSEGVIITDAELRIIAINPAFTETTGYSFAEIRGCKPNVLSSGKHDRTFYQEMWRHLNEHDRWQGEIWNRRKNGEVYPEWLSINAIRDDDGTLMHYAGMFSDISSQEHIRKRLHELAYYDDLTGLPNRELFHDRLSNAISQADRHDSRLALMFLDVDRFKNINDTLGHTTGDSLLKVIAGNLLSCVRQSDSVCRIGGDEFTILINEIDDPDDVVRIARKIIDSFSAPIRMADGMELYATTSIGICIYPNDGGDSEVLLKNADTAMYRAKEAGRNNYQFYTEEMSQHFAERLSLENDLRSAINAGLIDIAYQPQFDLNTGRIIGFEALARWRHPRHGWIPPTKFIPIAEDSGLIHKVGELVLDKACRQIRLWRDKYGPELRMAVNVSGHQLSQSNIVGYITDIMDRYQLPPDAIELELTESSLMENSESIISTLQQFSHAGIKISVDDFGTGYSSLSYIKRFAIDKLKIDRSFVQDIHTDNNDAEIVTTIIAMANNLSMDIIAEGVETEQQIDFLITNGCHQMQGHYFSPPDSAETMESLLGQNHTIVRD